MAKTERKKKVVPSLPEKLVTTPHELQTFCEHLAACPRFGLDTEFVGEESYHPKLCLIQVATEKALFLIDPQSVGPLDAFWRVVISPSHLVIVHAGREEVRLCQLWCGAAPTNLFDLQIAAGLVGFAFPLSHAKLVSQVLGVSLAKGETLTEWRNRPLTPEQVRYAFDDVRYLLPLWERLSGQLEALGRLSWAKEEFDRLKSASALSERNVLPTADRWRRLRGLGSLDRRRLAVLRELYDWREAAAAHANRPARTIVRDDLLVEIARRNPGRAKDLAVVRGLPKRSLEGIFEAVQRARALPLEACPEVSEKEQDPPQVALLLHLVSAVLADLCLKQKLAVNLVATQQDLKLLVRAYHQRWPALRGTALAEGWRAAHVLPQLAAVLEGRTAIAVSDPTAAAPLSYLALQD